MARTVFAISTTGEEHVIHSFGSDPDGAEPRASLFDVKGTLYGTTLLGGAYDVGSSGGTVFSITPKGSEHVLHSFRSGSDGEDVEAGMIAVDGVLYGTTVAGGTHNAGTVFTITPSGAENVLYTFGSSGDGDYPFASLLAVGGTLYGTTARGGKYHHGTVFALTP
jgi:uncharacterized repeat protein (TIGR03803 family)